ncbi:hypothetical protein HA402_003780 [Bradysia odoriphaga]|nr:hypothetical protein HA402_003780 [Bradysia odoriphaga]
MIAGIQHKPVGVFWDIENCSVPKNKSPSDVIAHVRNFFVFNRLNHREYEFIVSCDVTRLRKDIPEDINKAGGVTLAHVNGSSKNAADEKLRENMKKFVDTHATGSSPVLILISGDIDFVNDLRGYQTRLGCTIVLIHAANCSSQFKVGWNETYCFTSFCSAVKDNPANGLTKNLPKKPNQKSQNGPQNENQTQGGPANPKPQGGPKVNLKNQPGQPEPRSKPNDQRPYRQSQPGNKNEMTQQSAHLNPRERAQNPTNVMPPFRHPGPIPPQHQGQRFPVPPQNQSQRFSVPWQHQSVQPQSQGWQPGQGAKNKPLRNGPGTENSRPFNSEQQPTNDTGSSPTTVPPADKPATNKFILMVGGLPGKMDFKILKENLQFQAHKVHGKVKYVKNGQAFITFKNKANADRAVELFNGKQVFGKTLNVSFTKSIPFENQPNDKPTLGSDSSAVVKKSDVAEGSKKSKNKGSNKDESNVLDRAVSGSNMNLNNDPVLAGLGSIIGGIVANRIAAANPGNKSPESCPIQ